jgi:DnaJ-class molecular chaperone
MVGSDNNGTSGVPTPGVNFLHSTYKESLPRVAVDREGFVDCVSCNGRGKLLVYDAEYPDLDPHIVLCGTCQGSGMTSMDGKTI